MLCSKNSFSIWLKACWNQRQPSHWQLWVLQQALGLLSKGAPISGHGCREPFVPHADTKAVAFLASLTNTTLEQPQLLLCSTATLAGQQAPNPSSSRWVATQGFGDLPSPNGACKHLAPISPGQVEGKGLLPELSKKRKRKAPLLIPILAQLAGAGSCVCRCTKFYWLALEWGGIKQTRQVGWVNHSPMLWPPLPWCGHSNNLELDGLPNQTQSFALDAGKCEGTLLFCGACFVLRLLGLTLLR